MLLNREAASKYLENHEGELAGFVVHEIIHITTLVVGPNYEPNISPRAGRRVGAFLTTTPVDPAWRDRTSVVHLELCDSAAILLLLLIILIRIPLVLSLPRIITRPLPRFFITHHHLPAILAFTLAFWRWI